MLVRMSDTAPLNASVIERIATVPDGLVCIAHHPACAHKPWRWITIQLIICVAVISVVVIAAAASPVSNTRSRDITEMGRAQEYRALVPAEKVDRSFQPIEIVRTAVENVPNDVTVLAPWGDRLPTRYPNQETAKRVSFSKGLLLKTLDRPLDGLSDEIDEISSRDRLFSATSFTHNPVAQVASATITDDLASWKRLPAAMFALAMIIAFASGVAVFLIVWPIVRKLRVQNQRYDEALNNMSQGLATFDSVGRLMVCNDRYRQMYDLSPEQVKPGATILGLLKYRVANGTFSKHPEVYVRNLLDMVAQRQTETHIVEIGGSRFISVVNESIAKGGWVSLHNEVTDAIRQEEALTRAYQELIEKQYAIDQAVIVAITDLKGIITYANDNFCRISGYAREELLGQNHRLLKSGIHSKEFFREMFRQIANGHVWRGEICNKAKNNSLYWVDTTITPLLGSEGKPIAYMAIRVDITAKKSAEAKISYMAKYDVLTGVGNRAALNEELEEALAGLRGGQETFAVLLLDLDGFKHVNDTLGHAAGDELLKAIAGRLKSVLGESDTLTRLGGDEFAIIQGGAANQREAAISLALRVLENVGEPLSIDGYNLAISTSIGIALVPEDAASAGDILKKADLALYSVKTQGRNSFRFFEAEMSKDANKRLQLLADLRAALIRNEFELYYQPVFNAKTGLPCGVEALVRWHHPIEGLISPDRFIPLAEETGLMEPLGEWILERACMDATSWPDDITVAVNLSAVQFRSRKLFDTILCALVETGLDPQRLELEITESVLLQSGESYGEVIQQLKNIGVSIALDDFGTGYSSLSYLTTFPFDKIKIDKSFTRGLTSSASCAAIVASVLTLARGLDMVVTAEGVETKRELDLLRAAGVQLVQGYLFARPTPKGELDFSVLEQGQGAVDAA